MTRNKGGMNVERLTTSRKWEEAKEDLRNELGYSHIWKRLNAIEDILGDDYDLARLRELAEADRGGRFILTKCKTGDTIFVVGNKKIIKTKVREICFNDVFELIYLVEFKCDNMCDGCPFHLRSPFLDEEMACEGDYGAVFVKQSDFCKTVFLSREAAEEALKGEQND